VVLQAQAVAHVGNVTHRVSSSMAAPFEIRSK
jgi:hypothetical protein